MTHSPFSAGSDAVAAPLASGRRERIRVRRRRARSGSRWRSKWPRSRRRVLWTAFICAGVLALMGTGLYFSLSFLSSPPANPRSVLGAR
jgi:hypothetical protein